MTDKFKHTILKSTTLNYKVPRTLLLRNKNAVTDRLCSFIACPITHLYMGNSTVYFTTNNCSEERGTMMKVLDTLSTRTGGFQRKQKIININNL